MGWNDRIGPEADWLLWSRGARKADHRALRRGYQPVRLRAPPARASVYENEGRSQPGRIEPSYKAYSRLRVLGRPGVTDFDPLGQKLQEDADADRQGPTLPKIDGIMIVCVYGVEFLED